MRIQIVIFKVQKYIICMVSKNQIKLITSLAQKKYRNKNKLFLVEGIKTIHEFLFSTYKLHSLFTTEDIFKAEKDKTYEITFSELKKISQLTTPQTAVAVFHIPEAEKSTYSGLTIALDGLRDPGNLGTIIRLCDWFNISQLICSEDTVDCYNPKVVQASMGSLARVQVSFLNLKNHIEAAPQELPIFGTFMEGNNVYQEKLPSEGIIVMGNEANGISFEIEKLVKSKLSIPQFGNKQTESLNVATATSILLSEFKRTVFTEM